MGQVWWLGFYADLFTDYMYLYARGVLEQCYTSPQKYVHFVGFVVLDDNTRFYPYLLGLLNCS